MDLEIIESGEVQKLAAAGTNELLDVITRTWLSLPREAKSGEV